MYLCNSLALAESKRVFFNGNPGTTLQIMGAAILKISHALCSSGKESLESAVLGNPEFYLNAINMALVSLNILMLFIIGMVAFSLTGNIWLSLLLQFSPFLSTTIIIQGFPRVSVEPLLLFAGLLFVLILVKIIFCKNLSKSVHWYILAFAFVSGFGIATKITFFPLLLIPLFALPKLRNKIWFLILTALSVALWIWPVISQYKYIIFWYYHLFTHVDVLGTGKPGIIDTGIYWGNFKNQFFSNLSSFLIWFFVVGFMAVFMRHSKNEDGIDSIRNNAWQDISIRILVAILIAQLFAVLIVSKHNFNHYLLPVISLSGFLLFLVFVNLQKFNNFHNRFDIRKMVFILGIILLFSCVCGIIGIRMIYMQKMQIKEETLAVYQEVESKYKNYFKIISYFPIDSSSPVCALAFGNFYTKGLFSETLNSIYGEKHFYSVLSGEFHGYDNVFYIEDVIFSGCDKIIFYGPPISVSNKVQIEYSTGSTLYLKDIYGGQYKTIYVLEGIKTDRSRRNPPISPSPHFDFFRNILQFP